MVFFSNFQMGFYFVTTGWIFEIGLCENSINQSRVYALVEIFLHSEIFTHAWTKSFGMNKRPSARSEKERGRRVRTKKELRSYPSPGLSVYAYHTNGW